MLATFNMSKLESGNEISYLLFDGKEDSLMLSFFYGDNQINMTTINIAKRLNEITTSDDEKTSSRVFEIDSGIVCQ